MSRELSNDVPVVLNSVASMRQEEVTASFCFMGR